MLNQLFATKKSMTQAWDKKGRRLAVTKVIIEPNLVVDSKQVQIRPKKDSLNLEPCWIFEIGYGQKKFKNTSKPLQKRLERSGFSFGVRQLRGIRFHQDEAPELKVGDQIKISDVLAVGDMVKVQGITKGRGFAGAMKRHGFHGGPRTHGQSDRERAVGSIGAGTYPGRVWKGKRMPGHFGVEVKTVDNLVVLYIDEANNQVWLSGPIPGAYNSIIKIIKTQKNKQVELDKKASGIIEPEVKE